MSTTQRIKELIEARNESNVYLKKCLEKTDIHDVDITVFIVNVAKAERILNQSLINSEIIAVLKELAIGYSTGFAQQHIGKLQVKIDLLDAQIIALEDTQAKLKAQDLWTPENQKTLNSQLRTASELKQQYKQASIDIESIIDYV